MNERAKRINEAIEKSGYSYPELSKLTGISKSSLQRYATGETVKIPIDSIEAIAKATNTSAKYLMCWDSTPKNAIKVNTDKLTPIPLVGRVAAGRGCFADDNITEYIQTDSDVLKDGYEHFWLEVKGDSMEPELHEHDLVLIRKQETLENECFAVVNIDQEDGVVKLVDIEPEHITLTSLNRYYPPRVFEREEMNRVYLVGKVIEIKRRLE